MHDTADKHGCHAWAISTVELAEKSVWDLHQKDHELIDDERRDEKNNADGSADSRLVALNSRDLRGIRTSWKP